MGAVSVDDAYLSLVFAERVASKMVLSGIRPSLGLAAAGSPEWRGAVEGDLIDARVSAARRGSYVSRVGVRFGYSAGDVVRLALGEVGVLARTARRAYEYPPLTASSILFFLANPAVEEEAGRLCESAPVCPGRYWIWRDAVERSSGTNRGGAGYGSDVSSSAVIVFAKSGHGEGVRSVGSAYERDAGERRLYSLVLAAGGSTVTYYAYSVSDIVYLIGRLAPPEDARVVGQAMRRIAKATLGASAVLRTLLPSKPLKPDDVEF